MDVNLLYTSIVQEDVIMGVATALHEKTDLKQEQYILDGLKMAMECNYFWYDKKYFIQTKAVAMGVQYAPSVANLLMNLWEDEYIYNEKYPEIKLYRRYIDNLVILWDGTVEKFQQFLLELNNNRFGLSFTGKNNSECIEYLDLEIYKIGTSLHTRTFFKGNRS